MTGPRRLILLRHAKSDWADVPDRDRPLAKRGRRDAPKIGRWLRERGYLPDTVICPDARPPRQTWDRVARELGGSPSVTFEPRAYAASATTLLYLVMELPATSRTALLIGHNPGVSELATSLALPPDGDDAPIRFPTAAAAILDVSGDWADLVPGRARLLYHTSPAAPPPPPPPTSAPDRRAESGHSGRNGGEAGAGYYGRRRSVRRSDVPDLFLRPARRSRAGDRQLPDRRSRAQAADAGVPAPGAGG